MATGYRLLLSAIPLFKMADTHTHTHTTYREGTKLVPIYTLENKKENILN